MFVVVSAICCGFNCVIVVISSMCVCCGFSYVSFWSTPEANMVNGSGRVCMFAGSVNGTVSLSATTASLA